MSNGFPLNKLKVDVNVAEDAQLSSAGEPGGMHFVAVISPAEITGTNMTFEISIDGVNFHEVLIPDEGTAYTVKIAATKLTPVDYRYFWFAPFIKVKCATAQEAARVFSLVFAA